MKCLGVAVLLLVVGVSCTVAKEHTPPSREKVIAFTECIICSDNPEIQQGYDKCNKMKPKLAHEMKSKCLKEVVGDAVDVDHYQPALCAKEDGAGLMYDCMKKIKESGSWEPKPEDREKWYNFMTCAIELKGKHCTK